MDYTIPANVENLSITGGTARSATGNSGNNTLTGNSAATSLIGAAGDDTYVIADATAVVIEFSSEGTDLIQASVTYTAPSNVEQLTLTGSSNINATGNTCEVPEVNGVLVVEVVPSTPADDAGIEQCDLIQKVDGVEVNNPSEVQLAVDRGQVGEPMQLTLERQGQPLTIEVRPKELPRKS